MPEEVEIRPRAQGERIFVPFNVRAPESGLEALARTFNIAQKTTETLVQVAEREEATRVAGQIVDPTITDEALDRFADDARFNLTKVKIANRRGQVQFDRERQRIEESMRNVTDPAEVRAGLRAYKVEQLGKIQDPAQQAGFMEAFAGFAEQRIQRAHVEREAHLTAEDDALVGSTFGNALENYPEEFGALFAEHYTENALFEDTGRLTGRVIDAAVSHALLDPEHYDASIDALESMLDAGVIDDSEERRKVAEARNRLLAGKSRADGKAGDVADELRKIEYAKAEQRIVKARLEDKPVTEEMIENLLRTSDPGDAFKNLGALETFLNRDVQSFDGGVASQADMNAFSTAVRLGEFTISDILNLSGTISAGQQEELLRLHESMRTKNNPTQTDEFRLERRAMREQLKLDFIDTLDPANAAVNSEIAAGFERWVAGLPEKFSRPENSAELARMVREKRRELVEEAEVYRAEIAAGRRDVQSVQRAIDASLRTHEHLPAADNLFHGYVQ